LSESGLTTGCRQAAGSRRCARQTGQHCSSQNQSGRKKKSSSSSSSRNNNIISNRQMTGLKRQKPPSERPRNERGGA
ncbi:pilus protein, partial [Escherichia coli]|uniref:pilus protein n=4 Tax=Escherichia coli TaxID=562 RepID=UPI0039FBA35F